jgi:FtsZ-interacting cell division protein ZipA
MVRQHQPGSSFRPRVDTSSARPMFRPAQPQAAGQGFSTPQCQGIQCANNLQTPVARNHSVQRTHATQDPQQADRRCHNCGEKEHYANRRPHSHTRANQHAIATPAPTRGATYVPVATKRNYTHGRVNHVAVEEAREALDVVIGMFLVNETSAVVLFDSRASHSIIFSAYVGKYNLPLPLLRCQMIVSSPGGDMPARQLYPKVNLKIRG